MHSHNMDSSNILPEPNEREARPEWSAVPPEVLHDIEEITGHIRHAEIAWGGYSPSACFCVQAEKGDFFIKGSHPAQTSHGAAALRQEVHTYQTLDFLENYAPKFHGTVSFGDEDCWRLGIWSKISGQTALPWTEDKVRKAVTYLYDLHQNVHKEDVPDLPHGRDSNYVSDFFLGKRNWKRFAVRDDSNRQDHFCAMFQDPKQAEKWLEKYLDQWISYQDGVVDVEKPEGVLHFDLRSDNILFDENGKPVIIDWANACWGPILFDLVSFAICVRAESQIHPQYIMTVYEDLSGFQFPKEHILSVISVICGYFADNIWRNVPKELPRIRWIQKQCLNAGLIWMADETDIAFPGYFQP